MRSGKVDSGCDVTWFINHSAERIVGYVPLQLFPNPICLLFFLMIKKISWQINLRSGGRSLQYLSIMFIR